jgi:hypothetical protein
VPRPRPATVRLYFSGMPALPELPEHLVWIRQGLQVALKRCMTMLASSGDGLGLGGLLVRSIVYIPSVKWKSIQFGGNG